MVDDVEYTNPPAPLTPAAPPSTSGPFVSDTEKTVGVSFGKANLLSDKAPIVLIFVIETAVFALVTSLRVATGGTAVL